MNRDAVRVMVIQVLLDAGADLEASAGDGFTPLMLAAEFNENPMVS